MLKQTRDEMKKKSHGLIVIGFVCLFLFFLLLELFLPDYIKYFSGETSFEPYKWGIQIFTLFMFTWLILGITCLTSGVRKLWLLKKTGYMEEKLKPETIKASFIDPFMRDKYGIPQSICSQKGDYLTTRLTSSSHYRNITASAFIIIWIFVMISIFIPVLVEKPPPFIWIIVLLVFLSIGTAISIFLIRHKRKAKKIKETIRLEIEGKTIIPGKEFRFILEIIPEFEVNNLEMSFVCEETIKIDTNLKGNRLNCELARKKVLHQEIKEHFPYMPLSFKGIFTLPPKIVSMLSFNSRYFAINWYFNLELWGTGTGSLPDQKSKNHQNIKFPVIVTLPSTDSIKEETFESRFNTSI